MTGPLIDVDGRVRDLAREERRRRNRLIAQGVAVTLVLAALAWVLTASPLFSVRRVVVTGNSVVSAAAITKAAAVGTGTPLTRVDTAAAARRIQELPGIGRADVTVTFPDAVTVRVSERVVAFVLPVTGGFAWVDPSGQRFNQSASRPAGVPLAQANPDDKTLLADVATVASALPAKLTQRTRQISAQTRDSIRLELSSGVEIIWGSADESSLKGRVAEQFVRAVPKARTIDVSSPAYPTTR